MTRRKASSASPISSSIWRSARPARRRKASLDNRFASLGVAFGRDQNATTGLESTVYQMDLPNGDLAAVARVLDWLRGAADGILFTPAAVDVERGVVLAELRARRTPTSLGEQRSRRDSRARACARSTASRAAPRHRCARRPRPGSRPFTTAGTGPKTRMLVIVGDAEPEAQLEGGRGGFGELDRARTGRDARRRPPRCAERGLDALHPVPARSALAESACRLAPPDGPRDPEPRADAARDPFADLDDDPRRAARPAGRPGRASPLLGAAPSVNRDLPDALIACLIVVPNQGKWREASPKPRPSFAASPRPGRPPLEVETVTEELRSRLRGARLPERHPRHPRPRDQIVEAELDGRVFHDPEEAMRTYDLLVAGLTPDDVKRAFEADWTRQRPAARRDRPAAPAKEELIAAWRANEAAAPLAALPTATGSTGPMAFGKRGKVAARQASSRTSPGSPSRTESCSTSSRPTSRRAAPRSGSASARASAGSAPPTGLPMALAAGLFPIGGLGKMDYEQIASALTNTTWAFTLGRRRRPSQLKQQHDGRQCRQQMHLLAAYMTDPGFRPLMDDKLPTAIDFVYRSSGPTPVVAVVALERAALSGPASRCRRASRWPPIGSPISSGC